MTVFFQHLSAIVNYRGRLFINYQKCNFFDNRKMTAIGVHFTHSFGFWWRY